MKISYNIRKNLCIMIIISLCIPSFSSLTKEGELFVTKAEFDSALADFNGRLTSFESSINSKIDSQVGTYLERNGIWKGRDQVRDTIYYKAEIKASDVDVSTSSLAGEKEWGFYNYITEINKSGLLVARWLWRNKSMTNSAFTRWGWYGDRESTSAPAGNSGFNVSFNLYERKTNSLSDDLIYLSNFMRAEGTVPGFEATNSLYYVMATLSAESIYSPIQVFVKKGSCIKWKIICTYHFDQISSISDESSHDESILYIELENGKVY